jgi:hypothetical protein
MRLSAKYQSNPTECLSKSGALFGLQKSSQPSRLFAPALWARGKTAGFCFRNVCGHHLFPQQLSFAEAIRMAVEKLPQDSPTRRKAEDIALLYKEYIKELAQGYGDGTTRMDEFVKKAPELDILHESHVYIAGFLPLPQNNTKSSPR